MTYRRSHFVLGIVLLLIVDLIWVLSAEITRYLLHGGGEFDKPFFSCYLKTAFFLVLFPVYGVWCFLKYCLGWYGPIEVLPLENVTVAVPGEEDQQSYQLSEPLFVRTLPSEAESQSGISDDGDGDLSTQRRQNLVRFAKVSEVRSLPEDLYDEAKFARLSYEASIRSKFASFQSRNSIPVKTISWLALVFTVVFFLGNYFYQLSLQYKDVSVVNTISTTSSFFALVLAALIPSGEIDRISPSKVIAVTMNLGGVAMVALSGEKTEEDKTPMLGIYLALAGALLYAVYAVLLSRAAPDEKHLNVPLFFGFVGLYSTLFLWPGFIFLHYFKIEEFQWPNRTQWMLMVVNGLVGTVLSEVLWACGCLMTSSVMATLLPSLVIPLSILADHIIEHCDLPRLFMWGLVPIAISVGLMAYLKDGEDQLSRLCKKRRAPSFQTRASVHAGDEEREALIDESSVAIP